MNYERYTTLKVNVEGGIGLVTLNRPDLRNAIDAVAHAELEDVWGDLSKDDAVNVIVLTGSGKAFSAGGNIKVMAARHRTDEGWRHSINTINSAKRLVDNMLTVSKPILCAINGDAMGLGATIALLTDTTVMSETARIGDTHVRVGLVAGDGGSLIWPLLIGISKAKEYLMRGKVITGTEAEKLNLVNYAVPEDQVMAKTMEIAQDINGLPPLAVRWTKVLHNKMLKEQFSLMMDAAIAYEMLSMNSRDHGEAAQAFIEKRPPVYTGQ